jgi:heme/copper-type cytochrome/quinol oxidase subunit 2
VLEGFSTEPLFFDRSADNVLIAIVLFVGWLIYNTIFYYEEFSNKFNSRFVHSDSLEIVWTTIPALILLTLSTPSFTLLYAMDEISEPELPIKILGYPWFWSYEISDFNSCRKNQKYLNGFTTLLLFLSLFNWLATLSINQLKGMIFVSLATLVLYVYLQELWKNRVFWGVYYYYCWC